VDRLVSLFSRGLLALSAAACAGITGLVVLAVLMRYAVGAPLRETEELSGLLLCTLAFLALPAVMARHDNIRVTLVTDRLSGLPRRIAWVLAQAVAVAFCAIFALEAWNIAEFTLRLGLRSEQSRLPLAPFVLLLPASMALVGAIAAWQALRPPPETSGA
jgi:TRAP-type C4-dicarboxylate transport system permease small subunit